MSDTRAFTSLQDFRDRMAERGITPVLLQAIVREEGKPDCPSYLNGLIERGIIDFEFCCTLLAKWEGNYDTYMEMGVQNEEMFCNNQMPVRLVSYKGRKPNHEVP